MPLLLRSAGFEALWHPELLFAAVCLGAAYLQVTGPLRPRFPDAGPVPAKRRWLFLAGLAALYVAQGSPLELLSNEYLLSAHMLQAVILLFCAPPLLLMGTPDWLLRPVLRVGWVRALIRFVTHPLRALVVFVCVFSLYLFPSLTDAALANAWLYLLEHALTLVAALAMWWPLVSPVAELPPLPEPLQLLYAFFVEVLMTVAFALITFSDVPLYPVYAHGAPLLGIPALNDQALAGAIMRIGSMASYGVICGRAFAHWARRDESELPPEMHMPGKVPRPAPPRGDSA